MYQQTPEGDARLLIDQRLEQPGWVIPDVSGLNLSASRGVAVREVQSKGGPADDMLFVDGKALGIVEERYRQWLETWQSIQPEGAAFKRAKSACGEDPQFIIEELNDALID